MDVDEEALLSVSRGRIRQRTRQLTRHGRSRAGLGVARPSPIRTVAAAALTGSLGRFSSRVSGGVLSRGCSAEKGRAQMLLGSPTLSDAGLLVVRRSR